MRKYSNVPKALSLHQIRTFLLVLHGILAMNEQISTFLFFVKNEIIHTHVTDVCGQLDCRDLLSPITITVTAMISYNWSGQVNINI